MTQIKSPLGQTGHKYKLLDQLLPHFPETKVFTEPFVGSGNVAVNVDAEKIVINDSCQPIVEWLTVMYEEPIERILYRLDKEIEYYKLSASNKKGYYTLRDAYNLLPNPYWFYLLNAHSFSNQIRFAKAGNFNLPFGVRTFNPTRRRNMINFVKKWQQKNVEFHSTDFEELEYEGFVYFDPPYTNGVASYNTGWSTDHDQRLFTLLNRLDNKGIKWALSNALTNNGKINHLLSRWSGRYRVIDIYASYRGSNYQRGDNGNTSEVLVVNY